MRPNRALFLILSLLLLVNFFSACSPTRPPVPPGTIPTGRAPTLEDEQYGHKVVNSLTDKYKLAYNHPRSSEVDEVVKRLTAAAKVDSNPWHVYLFDDKNFKNAAATRGNHVFIWTGLLDYTRNEDELAAIVGHEISHVLAGHTDPNPNEEIKRILISVGATAAGIAVAIATNNPNYSGDLGNLTSSLTQEIGEGLFLNPFAQGNELEADQIGLFMMADAKYDPKKAVEFWERAATDPSFSSGLGLLSTHPPASERFQNLKKLLPQAIARYEGRAPAPPQSPTILSNTSYQSGNPSALPMSSEPDSFAINPGMEHNLITRTNSWQVISSRAILYKTPSTKSKRLGDFKRGAKVNVVSETKGWVEIDHPEHGYLSRKDLGR